MEKWLLNGDCVPRPEETLPFKEEFENSYPTNANPPFKPILIITILSAVSHHRSHTFISHI